MGSAWFIGQDFLTRPSSLGDEEGVVIEAWVDADCLLDEQAKFLRRLLYKVRGLHYRLTFLKDGLHTLDTGLPAGCRREVHTF